MFCRENPVPLSRWQQKPAPDDAFIDLPHLHEFIANGVVPVSDFPFDDSLERDPDGERETVARLHAAFTDGWRMNASELLECAEYLQGTSRASASMRIDEWRNRYRTRSEPAPNYAEFIHVALSKPLTTATPLDDERTREIIERDLPKWKKIFAEDSLPQPLEMALRDYRLARHRDADEIQHTKFARRLFQASRCLKEMHDEDFDGASASTAKHASQLRLHSRNSATTRRLSIDYCRNGPTTPGDRIACSRRRGSSLAILRKYNSNTQSTTL